MLRADASVLRRVGALIHDDAEAIVDSWRRVIGSQPEEIGRRHTPLKKNKTDAATTPPLVPLRYLISFTAVVITSIGQFAQQRGVEGAELERVQHAWSKA